MEKGVHLRRRLWFFIHSCELKMVCMHECMQEREEVSLSAEFRPSRRVAVHRIRSKLDGAIPVWEVYPQLRIRFIALPRTFCVED